MESESHDVIPVNSQCSTIVNKSVISPSIGTETATTHSDIDSHINQVQASSQYDNVDSMEVKPMYGGNMNIYIVNFKNKIIILNGINEKEVIKKILNNKIYKRDNLLQIKIKNSKNESMYIIRGTYKNKFIKI